MICIGDKDLPEAFQEADAESRDSQLTYIRIFLGILIATSVGALGTWFAVDYVAFKMLGSVVAAFAMLAAFILTTILSMMGLEQNWYAGRAVAESVKTRSWSYMMKGERYPYTISEGEADRRFVDDLNDILKEKGALTFKTCVIPSSPQISEAMRSVRSLPVGDRLATYLQCRVQDQREWYRAKAKLSASKQKILFLFMQATQAISFVLVGYYLYERQVTSGAVGLLAAIGASVLAWLQVKKYQETAQSYSITHQELTSVEALAKSVLDESGIAQFVQDTENAVSREHTLWVAKRIIR